ALENHPGRCGLVGNHVGQDQGGIVLERTVRAQDSRDENIEVVVTEIATGLVRSCLRAVAPELVREVTTEAFARFDVVAKPLDDRRVHSMQAAAKSVGLVTQ